MRCCRLTRYKPVNSGSIPKWGSRLQIHHQQCWLPPGYKLVLNSPYLCIIQLTQVAAAVLVVGVISVEVESVVGIAKEVVAEASVVDSVTEASAAETVEETVEEDSVVDSVVEASVIDSEAMETVVEASVEDSVVEASLVDSLDEDSVVDADVEIVEETVVGVSVADSVAELVDSVVSDTVEAVSVLDSELVVPLDGATVDWVVVIVDEVMSLEVVYEATRELDTNSEELLAMD